MKMGMTAITPLPLRQNDSGPRSREVDEGYRAHGWWTAKRSTRREPKRPTFGADERAPKAPVPVKEILEKTLAKAQEKSVSHFFSWLFQLSTVIAIIVLSFVHGDHSLVTGILAAVVAAFCVMDLIFERDGALVILAKDCCDFILAHGDGGPGQAEAIKKLRARFEKLTSIKD